MFKIRIFDAINIKYTTFTEQQTFNQCVLHMKRLKEEYSVYRKDPYFIFNKVGDRFYFNSTNQPITEEEFNKIVNQIKMNDYLINM